MTDKQKWPENVQLRTEQEWRELGTQENWTNPEVRQVILGALTALKIPAMNYARLQAPGRVELIIAEQEKRAPGSTAGKKESPKPAAAAPAAAGKKAAAPKAAGTGTAPASSSGGVATVDLGPVLAKFEALDERLNGLEANLGTVSTILKLLLLNPANADSLALAATQEVVDDIAGKSLAELAGGNE